MLMVLSLLSLASLAEQKSVIPVTTTGRETNRPPMDFRDEVNQGVKMPPSSELLKKARWKAGTRPRTAPTMAPSSGVLKKSRMKRNHHFMRGER
jgi:hypothetical protein